MEARRLGPGDEAVALETFATMAAVFEEDCEGAGGAPPTDEAYARRLLERTDFWAVVATDEGRVLGGVTAHALPMTRNQATELFIYDIAVRDDAQRRGVGRLLVTTLRELAAAAGITTSFVPADDEDTHAIAFYRALGGEATPVTFFTFER